MAISFIIAGVQKGGTTALHRFLSQHPRIFMPDRKELHFFDDENHDWSRPDYDRHYHCHFAGVSPEQVCGEATPIYTYWPPSIERIHAYNREIKLIVSLRDPAERAYSHWRMEKERNVEPLPFSVAIRDGRTRVANGAEFHGFHRTFSYVERGFYFEQLDRIFSLFPRNRVFLLDQRKLLADHGEVLNEICDFLDIQRFAKAPQAEMIFSEHDPSTPPLSKEDRAFLGQIYREDLHALKETYGMAFPPDQGDSAG